VAFVAGLALFNARNRGQALGRAVYSAGLSGLATVSLFGLYQFLAFGSPFHTGYAHDRFNTADAIGGPNLRVLGQLVYGTYRGVLPLSPVLALAPVGFVLMWRARRFAPSCVAPRSSCTTSC
jgi:hypothetical protein